MKRSCTILFMDGESMRFEFEQQKRALVVARFLKEALDGNTLALEVDGKLMVFPMANLRSITLDPAPEEFPETVITGASIDLA